MAHDYGFSIGGGTGNNRLVTSYLKYLHARVWVLDGWRFAIGIDRQVLGGFPVLRPSHCVREAKLFENNGGLIFRAAYVSTSFVMQIESTLMGFGVWPPP